MDRRVTIGHVVSTLKNAKDHRRACSLLIGAGCSDKAKIPLAAKFITIIEQRFADKVAGAERTYPSYMSRLSLGERHEIIADYIDKAPINWAHIAIAQLMKHGYVDRVLTTNFDPLVARACALVNVFPAVYDLAASSLFRPDQVARQAVFHLHGQRSGFIILNTEQECEEHYQRLAPVFRHAGEGRTWIVVGYSGENDPVFNHLASVDSFLYSLYWVGYLDSEPGPHVREHLLDKNKDAHFISGYDADRFFITLAQQLKCFPPDFIAKPLAHLSNCLDMLTPFPIDERNGEIDIVAETATRIRSCIDDCPKNAPKPVAPPQKTRSPAPQPTSTATPPLLTPQEAYRQIMAGDYDRLLQLPIDLAVASPDLAKAIAWARVLKGNECLAQARTAPALKADKLFTSAYQEFEAALKIKPDMHEALYNWGTVLMDQAKTKSGKEADDLFAQACAKYEAALKIKPDLHQALSNWGNALLLRAATKPVHEAENLLIEAEKNLLAAERLSPGSGAYNLACFAARRGQPDACREWLEKSRQAGKLPSPSHLRTDPDLQSMRTHPWFADFLAN